MTMQSNKPKSSIIKSEGLIEQLRDIGRGVGKNVTRDLLQGVTTDALSSLFGAPKQGVMHEGQEINLHKKPDKPEAIPESSPLKSRDRYRSPFADESLARLQRYEAEVDQKIEEIRQELKALIATLKVVDKQIEQAVDEQYIDPGLYHLTFLDRLKTILKLMRQNLTNSSSWLSVMRSRKKERLYWNMYKKKGTSFGLSNERNVATQVG